MPASTATSPRWGGTTKLVVALTFVAALSGLLIQFRSLIGPLAMAFILAYLFFPIAAWMDRTLPLSWRPSVSILYLVVVLLLLGLLALGGVGLLQQIQSLIRLVQSGLNELPVLVNQLTEEVVYIGPFALDFQDLDLNAVLLEVLSVVQSSLGQIGNLVGTLAGSALQTFAWTAFVLLISYFILIESGGLRERILRVEVPRYAEDIRRIGQELARTWNAFLRGQMILFFLTLIVYTSLLSLLGVRYALGIALLAGLARFVPYVGPTITWTVLALVAFFQTFKLFGMSPLSYTLLLLAVALFVDQIFDNFISPRVMADALRIHPAGVLVAAIIAANLFGILGVLVAAPILATLKLLSRYTLRKMLDLDPWPEEEESVNSQPAFPLLEWLRGWWLKRRSRPERAEEEE
jgi:predicted PurR-regulated permease PerM